MNAIGEEADVGEVGIMPKVISSVLLRVGTGKKQEDVHGSAKRVFQPSLAATSW